MAVVGVILVSVSPSRATTTPRAQRRLGPSTGITSENGYRFQVNTAADAPTVEIYEDFRCPACANLENQFGPLIQQEAADGNIN